MTQKVYQEIANIVQARKHCIENNNTIWISKHEDRLKEIEKSFLPSGSGIDNGCNIDIDKSTEDKVIIYTSFHHMNENGMYNGWTDHKIIITPSLMFDINLRITGINRNDIKEYLNDIFYNALTQEIKE